VRLLKADKNIKVYIGAFLLLFLFIFLPYSYISLFFILGFGIVMGFFFIVLSNKDDSDFLFSVFIISFILRILLGTFFYEFRLWSGKWAFMGDGAPYVYNGNIILDMWLGGVKNIDTIFNYVKTVSGSGTIGVYDFWNAIVLFFTDRNPMALFYINSLAVSFSALFIYGITRRFYNVNAARLSCLLTAFWPSIFLWSIQNFKEPITIFFITGAVYYLISILHAFRLRYAIMVLLFFAGLSLYRNQFFIILCLAVVFGLLYSFVLFKIKSRVFLFFIIGIFLLVLCILYVRSHYIKAVFEYVSMMRGHRAYGNFAFLQNIDFSNTYHVIFFLPISFIFIVLAPFPWQLTGISHIVTLSEMLVYYVILWYSVRSLVFLHRNNIRGYGVVVILIVFILMLLALFEGNIGTVFRHRAIILPFLFTLSAIGFEIINKDVKT
jgi:hypothetical protein